ncbi:GNAT family N-acetyltransferase [Pseudonocardia nematodicida]|uniref:GNAT family N-acetyltransferase n=1 Tax=Pseudonocardia nematodicida TaxID=1206997 RepID=A0ABV1KAD0_9PSEU
MAVDTSPEPDPAPAVLLHLCTPGEWRSWLDAGRIAPASLDEVGFVHLSTSDQVALPAQRLFAGRTDMILLVVDPAVLETAGVEVRWEPGVPTDPASMVFPHAYGPIPVPAVRAVLPYRPGPDGFTAPEPPVPDDDGFRAAHFEPSMLRRVADAEEPVTGGVAIRTATFPASRVHNRLLIDRAHLSDSDTLVAEAERTLTAHGLPAAALLNGPGARELATDLTAAGWEVHELELLAGPAGRDATGAAAVVSEVALDDVREFRKSAWGTDPAGFGPDELAQLVERTGDEDRVLAVHLLAVVEDGAVVAAATLRRDGATAWVEGMDTAPEHRGRGHGRALLARARELAAEHGCDLVALSADVADRPRDWYLRAGFAVVGTRFQARRPG